MAALRQFARPWSGDSGAELIEFALVLPLLLLTVLGIVDFGLLFQRYQVVTNAAREGARIAVLPGYSEEDVWTRVNQYLVAGGLNPVNKPPVNSRRLVLDSGQCISLLSVTVRYPHTYSFVGGIASFFGGDLTSTTLEAKSEMRSESAAGACP